MPNARNAQIQCHVCVIEPDEAVQKRLREALRAKHLTVHAFESHASALRYLATTADPCRIVICHVGRRGQGVEFSNELRRTAPGFNGSLFYFSKHSAASFEAATGQQPSALPEGDAFISKHAQTAIDDIVELACERLMDVVPA